MARPKNGLFMIMIITDIVGWHAHKSMLPLLYISVVDTRKEKKEKGKETASIKDQQKKKKKKCEQRGGTRASLIVDTQTNRKRRSDPARGNEVINYLPEKKREEILLCALKVSRRRGPCFYSWLSVVHNNEMIHSLKYD